MNLPIAAAEKRAQNPAHEANQNCAPKGAAEVIDVKAVHEILHEKKHQAIYDEDEKPEREHNQRRHEQEQNRPQESVQDSEEQGRAHERAEAVVTDALDHSRGDHHRDRRNRPAK